MSYTYLCIGEPGSRLLIDDLGSYLIVDYRQEGGQGGRRWDQAVMRVRSEPESHASHVDKLLYEPDTRKAPMTAAEVDAWLTATMDKLRRRTITLRSVAEGQPELFKLLAKRYAQELLEIFATTSPRT